MKIFHGLFNAYVWIIAHMPFALIRISSFKFYVLFYYIVGYRKKVVLNNLQNSFPDLDIKEIKRIRKRYYKNISDIFHEVLIARHISQKRLKKHVEYENPELLQQLYDDKRNIILVSGHFGNWEWFGLSLPLHSPYLNLGAAKPLSSKFFDNFIISARSRFGLNIIPFKSTYRVLLKHKDDLTLTYLAADQTPTKQEIDYWTNFLNQDTAVFLGAEKIANSRKSAVVYSEMKRTKKFHYRVKFTLITEDASQMPEHKVTEAHVRLLEKSITEQKDNWLWSHRRWKHKKES